MYARAGKPNTHRFDLTSPQNVCKIFILPGLTYWLIILKFFEKYIFFCDAPSCLHYNKKQKAWKKNLCNTWLVLNFSL